MAFIIAITGYCSLHSGRVKVGDLYTEFGYCGSHE